MSYTSKQKAVLTTLLKGGDMLNKDVWKQAHVTGDVCIRLRDKGMIERVETENGPYLHLTAAGREAAKKCVDRQQPTDRLVASLNTLFTRLEEQVTMEEAQENRDVSYRELLNRIPDGVLEQQFNELSNALDEYSFWNTILQM